MNVLPRQPGGYVLELYLAQTAVLQIGRLGKFTFPAGVYLYFGSAWGPGGLHARLGRHLLPASSHPIHWHIDYLRAVAEVRALGYLVGSHDAKSASRLECQWSQAIARLPESTVPVPGFGASDCRSCCPAHLLATQKPEAAEGATFPDSKLQYILANAASPAGALTNLSWLTIAQSDILPL